MKNCLNLILTAVAAVAIFSCENRANGDKASISEQQSAAGDAGVIYLVDTSDSRVRFTGYGIGKNHPGNFQLTTGTVAVSGKQVTGGVFIINIRSLEVEQREVLFQEKLKPHLLSGDFFNAEKFGEAKFEITSVKPFEERDKKSSSIVKGANFIISGNLTLKDETKNISFPAKIDLEDGILEGMADFDIDRTQWKLKYGNDKKLGDNFISEKVNIELKLKARRK